MACSSCLKIIIKTALLSLFTAPNAFTASYAFTAPNAFTTSYAFFTASCAFFTTSYTFTAPNALADIFAFTANGFEFARRSLSRKGSCGYDRAWANKIHSSKLSCGEFTFVKNAALYHRHGW